MRSRIRSWVMAAFLVLGLSAALVHGAAAQAGPLPAYTPFPSADFSLTGMISVGPQSLKLDGSGMQGGDQFQQQLNIATPQGTLTYDMVQVGAMFYFRTNANPQWQSIDLSKLPGGVPNIQSNVPGLNGFTPNGGQRTYEAVTASQQVGKETVEGAATTEYQGNVDVAKLYTSIGTPAAQVAQLAAVSKMTLYLWIGDADHYIHQQRVVLNSKAPGPNKTILDVLVDFTITYRNFGRTLAVTAPTGAVPYAPPTPVPATPPPAPGGSQQPAIPGLPQIKQPSSARFDLNGNISLGGQAITLNGSGAMAGTTVQLDMQLAVPGSPAMTIHLIETPQRIYTRSGNDTQWQYIDLTQGMAGMPGMLPGMTGGAGGLLMGLDPAQLPQILKDAVRVQQVGKETLGGAPTTKYQVDIDLAKAVNGINPGAPPDPQTQQLLASAKYMMFLWVGDNDQYLHQVQITLSLQVPDANNQPQTLGFDLTLTLHDFDTPITITEPTNAVPSDLGTGSGGGAVPVVAPPVIAPAPNPAPGMPRTGAPAGLPLPLFLVLGLGLALLGLGVRLRRADMVTCEVRNVKRDANA